MTDAVDSEEHAQARREAEERLRTFLWREGLALRAPVDMGYVTVDEAIPLLLAAYRRVLEDDPAATLRAAFEQGGPSPAERRAQEEEARILASVDAAKPLRKAAAAQRAAQQQTSHGWPPLRLAPPLADGHDVDDGPAPDAPPETGQDPGGEGPPP